MKKRLSLLIGILFLGTSLFAQTTLTANLAGFANTLCPSNETTNKAKYSFFTLTSDDLNIYAEEYVTDCLCEAMFNTGKIRVFERAQLEKLVEEQKFQSSGLVDEDTAKEIGKIAGVDFIVYGTMKNFRNKVILNVRVVNVQTGEICAINHAIVDKDTYLENIKFKKRTTKKTSSTTKATSYGYSSVAEESTRVESVWKVQKLTSSSPSCTVYMFECETTSKEKLRLFYVKYPNNNMSYVKAGIRWATEGHNGTFYVKDEKGNVQTLQCYEDVVKVNTDRYGYATYNDSNANSYFFNLFLNNSTVTVKKVQTGTVRKFNTAGLEQAIEEAGLSVEDFKYALSNTEF